MKGLISIGLLSLFIVYSYHTLSDFETNEPKIKQEEKVDGAFDWLNDFVKGLGEEVQRTIKDLQLDLFAAIIQQEQTEELYQDGFKYQEILKLHIISQLADTEIDDILAMENAVIVNEEGEKRVNVYVLIDAFGLSNEDIRQKIRDFVDDLNLYERKNND